MSFSFIFPGQGSQAVGMMSQLADSHDLVKQTFEQASDELGVDLWTLSQQGPIEELSQTENTQPSLLTAGVAAWRVWQQQGGDQPAIMAGHSLGEYTALVCASAISFENGVKLVKDRGRYMQEAVPAGVGGMAAVLGLSDQQVADVCTAAAQGDVLQAVNLNAHGQVVIAGHAAAIERGIVLAREVGAKRAMPLPVSIPAHSSLMSAASERLAARLADIDIVMPKVPVIHNCNLKIARTPAEIADNLVTQLDSPVRWVGTVEQMHQQYGINQFIESGPGRVLSGLVKRIVKGVEVACIEKPDVIEILLKS